MPRQPDLFGPVAPEIRPAAGRSEPRLWVRRLAIWSAPGVLLREIRLRPGLNVLWAPDPADRGGVTESVSGVGHGSGKTLFCRLLRYCLGEDRFAQDEQRERVAHAFPEGEVGAEVIVDGIPWAVVRSIGTGRRHVAVRDAALDQVARERREPTGMGPLLDAIAANFRHGDLLPLVAVDVRGTCGCWRSRGCPAIRSAGSTSSWTGAPRIRVPVRRRATFPPNGFWTRCGR